MEPRTNSQNAFQAAPVEQAVGSAQVENNPNTMPVTPEAPISSPEQARMAEQLGVDHQGGVPLPAAPAQPDPQVQLASQSPISAATAQTSTPASAGDDDLIDKEWLNKVKQVISSTADDPHAQQREVSRLMADYVLKRMGRKIGEDE